MPSRLQYPHRLSLARLPTPLTRIERFPLANDAVQLWVKRDEMTGTEVSGNKIRKLEFVIAEALHQGCNTLITCGGIQSNHCRATAILGARLGLKVHLILRGDEPETIEGNLLLDRIGGARISYLPVQEWSTHPDLAHSLIQDYAARGDRAYFIPIGASDEVGLWGYIAACEELRQDFQRIGVEPDYIITATGSGGTQGGLSAGAQLFGLKAQVLGFNVCDDAAWFEAKIRDDLNRWKQRYDVDLDPDRVPVTTIEGYMGPGYGIAGPEVFHTIARLAGSDGLFLDPVYTGKAFHGMVSELARGDAGCLADARNVLFIHTGGLFGLFPQQGNFSFAQAAQQTSEGPQL